MTTKFKVLYTQRGEHGQLPDGGITNIGGTSSSTFFVDGRPLMFADGSSTDGLGSAVIGNLQGVYNASSPATINLTSGKSFTLNALNSKIFQVDAATGKVTITGDLEVLGTSTVVEGVLSNVDQVSINPPNGTTPALLIEPIIGVVMAGDLVRIRAANAGLPVFRIDQLGKTWIGSVDFAQFYADFQTHIALTGIKHSAAQISVTPLTNFPTATNVQEVLDAINAITTGSVTSVGISSTDMTVTNSPITTSGTIALSLNTVPISKGGTGEVTATAAINALVPPQTGNGGKVLGTDGSTVNWVSSASITGAGLFFTDAAPTTTGIVGLKQYVAGTTPANKVINQATTDTNDVTVTLFAEGDSSFYSPTITVTTMPPQLAPIIATLVEDPNDKRAYTATAALVNLAADTVVTATSSTGAVATMSITRATVGPTVDQLFITSLPGVQTEVKSGDLVNVSGRTPNTAAAAEVLLGGASGAVSALTLGAANSAGAGFRTITGTFTVGGGSGAQTVQVRAQSALGTYGTPFTSLNSVVLNQTYPTIGARTITYPIGQNGLKGTETADISATVVNFDTIVYTGTDVSVPAPTTYDATKTVTRFGGSYSFGTNNYTISANKVSNNATTTASSAVSIANVAPSAAITIVGSPTRLFSSPTGTDYTVTITANQQLLSAPSLDASSGTWQGVWTGAGSTWTRVLRITDTDPKGAQLFTNLSATGLAGLVGTSITSGMNYTVGGFAARTITFAAFERWHAIGTTIVDISKVTASYTGSSVLALRADTNDVFQSFTITNVGGGYDPMGGYLFISDAAFAGANTTGTLQLTIAEAA